MTFRASYLVNVVDKLSSWNIVSSKRLLVILRKEKQQHVQQMQLRQMHGMTKTVSESTTHHVHSEIPHSKAQCA